MLIWTTRFSRKKAVFSVLIMGIVMVFLILLAGREDAVQPSPQQPLTDNAQRITYLESFGWKLDPEPIETLQFLFPEEMSESYLAYNELQKTQGFDLSPCCGKQLSRYTYHVLNYPEKQEGIQANLYICEDLPVAGDIFCSGANGFQTTLQYPESVS